MRAWHASGGIDAKLQKQFEKAIELDPEYALARCMYAGYLFFTTHVGYAAAHDSMPAIRGQARQALELDPSSADAHAILATVAAGYDYDWSDAERHYAQALSVPGLSPVSRAYCASVYLRGAGRLAEAIEQGELALQVDPIHPAIRTMLTLSLAYAGRFAEAETLARESIALAPDNLGLYSVSGLVRAVQGRFDEALALAEKAAQTPANPFTFAPFAGLLARAGRHARSEEVMDRIRAGPPHWLSSSMVLYYLYAGDMEGAADWAEKACIERWPALPATLQSPLASGLRAGPRWSKLSRMMNLPQTRSARSHV